MINEELKDIEEDVKILERMNPEIFEEVEEEESEDEKEANEDENVSEEEDE